MAVVPTIAVVGGGITGLVAARQLLATSDALVYLFEASDRFGGKLRTEELGGIRYEWGADSFLARDATATELCAGLGLEDELVSPAVFGAYVWHDERLKRFPPGTLYGLPARPGDARRTGLLTAWGALRARADLVLPGPLRGPDVSIGAFVRRRFGRQVLERMVDPLLAGTRAGEPDSMSLAAATPQIDELARTEASLIKALRRAGGRGEIGVAAPPFKALTGGMQRLTDAIAADIEARAGLRHNARVERITAAPDHLTLHLERGESLAANGVVLAVPAPIARTIVQELAPDAASDLARFRYASVGVITFTYPPGAVTPPPGGSGLLVPSGSDLTMSACTWFDVKWPEAAPADGRSLVRCFIGRADHHPALDLADDDLARLVAADLSRVLGAPEPESWRVARWPNGLPQYEVGHLSTVARVEATLEPFGIAVAGAGYRGSGIPDCIRQGSEAAHRVLARTTMARS